MQKEIIKVLSDLIRFESTQDNLEERKKAIEYVEKFCQKNKLQTKRLDSKNTPCILITLPSKNKKTLLISNHLDIVSATKDQFKPKVKGNLLYGRGSIDNKGQITGVLLALREIHNQNNKNAPTIKFLITTDEEIGGEDGVGRLVKNPNLKNIDAILCPDGGEEDKIVIKEKGVLHLKLIARGKSAHGAYLWLGNNAIEKLIQTYQKIKKEFSKEKQNKNHWHTTINLGKISGGTATNKVPDLAEMDLDIRFTEKYNVQKMQKKIQKLLPKNIKMKVISEGEVFSSEAKNNHLLKSYQKIMQKTLGKKINFGVEHGATDMRYFADKNIPIWLHTPKGANLHSENEYVDLNSLEKFTKGLIEFFGNMEI